MMDKGYTYPRIPSLSGFDYDPLSAEPSGVRTRVPSRLKPAYDDLELAVALPKGL